MTSLNKANVNKGTKFIMGKRVTVRVTGTYKVNGEDRRKHTVNCGYICTENESVERTAFVVGVEQPLSEYTGDIIAVIKNRETRKESWVIAPGGFIMYEPALAQLLGQFVDKQACSFICLYEKSCGAVLYTEEFDVRKFLLIKNMSGHIGFPKGHVEYGENERVTAEREVWEETGVHTKVEQGFREFYNYSVNSFVKKQAVYFVAPFKTSDIEMNIREISEYLLVTFDEGMKVLNYPHDRSILSKADKFITQTHSPEGSCCDESK
ncbi:MAG: NUDIX domain-containing protein [Clostridia bacterium]|nr:NUDIX domain-containing protein [Clostridia bacterium]